MLLVEAPLHVGACACNRNVVATVALFDGVLTTTLCEETVIFKSVSQKAPLLPQAFTRRMWLPALSETVWLMEVAPLRIWSVLLSKEYAMLAVFCPPQVGADACRRNALGTVVPFWGALTCTPVPTVMATSFSQKAPLLPQALTLKVCVPWDALTLVLMEVAGLRMVSLPESNEWAMLAVGWLWQLAELAWSRKGEATTEPLAGAETVISAADAWVAIPEMKMIKKPAKM